MTILKEFLSNTYKNSNNFFQRNAIKKPYGKRRNCPLQANSPVATIFSIEAYCEMKIVMFSV